MGEIATTRAQLARDHQIHFAADPNGTDVLGDCWRTCIASVLGVPRDDVPHFVELHRNDGTGTWWLAAREWLEARDLTIRHWDSRMSAQLWSPFLIASGKSPRGDYKHAVVIDADTGEMVHDPHPSGDGVMGGYDNYYEAIYPLAWDSMDFVTLGCYPRHLLGEEVA